MIVVGGFTVSTLSHLNPSCIELELTLDSYGKGRHKVKIKKKIKRRLVTLHGVY